MSYEKVLQASKIIIGTKQTVKALREGVVQELIIATDADAKVTAPAVSEAQKLSVPIRYVDSMKKLGRACRIEVSAAAVAIIR